MPNARKKISELTALTSASLDTVVVGVDNGTTYKIELDVLADGVRDRINTLDYQRLNSLETFTSSVNNASLNVFTSSQLTTNTTLTNNINGRLTTSSFNSFSASVHSEILAATNEQSFNGLISGSSQLTSSYDSRYVLSGSITQTTWDNINGKPAGLVSQSTDLTSLNSFTASNGNTSLNAATSSYETKGNGIVSGSSQIVGILGSLNSFTSSINTTIKSKLDADGVISGSSQLTSSFVQNSQTSSMTVFAATNVTVASSNTLNDSTLYPTFTNNIVNATTQLKSHPSGTFYYDGVTRKVYGESFVGAIEATNGVVSGSLQLTSSFETTGRGIISSSAQLPDGLISGSSQLTASYDVRYATSASYLTSLNGAISSSSQLTASYDVRYALSGSGGTITIPDGTVSGSSQLTSSFDTRYLNTGGDGVISGSSQITGIVNLTNLSATSQVSASTFVGGFGVPEAKFTVISSKAITFWPNITFESVRFTTAGGVIIGKNGETNDFGNKLDVSGSVRFIGNTTITGSLIGTQGFTGSIAATNGVVSGSSQVTDILTSLNTFTASNANTSLNAATSSYLTSLNGAISSSSQLTSSYDLRYENVGRNVVSGSSQLTSSFDTRYAASGSGGSIPVGTISGSSQIASLGYATTGSNTFIGTETISGSVRISGSVIVGSGSLDAGAPETMLIGQTTGSSYNTFTIKSNVNNYSQMYITNLNNGISASSDLVVQADNGSQTNMFADLGVNSSGYTGNGNGIGAANDAYVYGKAKNFWVGNNTTSSLYLFANPNGTPDIILSSSVLTISSSTTIQNSLTINTGTVISSSLTAASSSLTLNSGSNFYLQNNGIAQITGSLLVSGSTTFTGSISISSGSITMPDRPAFRVVGTGGGIGAVRTLSGSLYTTDWQQGSGWDVSTGTFTAPIAGLYQVNLVTRTNSNSYASATQFIVYKNNTGGVTGTPQIMIEYGANTSMNHTGGSTISKLAVGDTLRLVLATGSGSFDVNDNFSVAYIG